MQPGYICVAGINVQDNEHIRPVLGRARLTVDLLARNGGAFDVGRTLDRESARFIRNVRSKPATYEDLQKGFSVLSSDVPTRRHQGSSSCRLRSIRSCHDDFQVEP